MLGNALIIWKQQGFAKKRTFIMCTVRTRKELNQIIRERFPFLNARKKVAVGKGIICLELAGPSK